MKAISLSHQERVFVASIRRLPSCSLAFASPPLIEDRNPFEDVQSSPNPNSRTEQQVYSLDHPRQQLHMVAVISPVIVVAVLTAALHLFNALVAATRSMLIVA